ncbi:MAG: hypothetical protein ACOY4U_03245 [Pseudomonadota bacterium]
MRSADMMQESLFTVKRLEDFVFTLGTAVTNLTWRSCRDRHARHGNRCAEMRQDTAKLR